MYHLLFVAVMAACGIINVPSHSYDAHGNTNEPGYSYNTCDEHVFVRLPSSLEDSIGYEVIDPVVFGELWSNEYEVVNWLGEDGAISSTTWYHQVWGTEDGEWSDIVWWTHDEGITLYQWNPEYHTYTIIHLDDIGTVPYRVYLPVMVSVP